MSGFIYLDIEEVLFIHDDQIRLAGGAPGVRDMGILESALFRPQTGYYPDLIAEASALWESLAMNHPFIDGNKRVAIAATFTFLHGNGTCVTAEDGETWRFVLGALEAGRFNFDTIDTWLRANTASR